LIVVVAILSGCIAGDSSKINIECNDCDLSIDAAEKALTVHVFGTGNVVTISKSVAVEQIIFGSDCNRNTVHMYGQLVNGSNSWLNHDTDIIDWGNQNKVLYKLD